ncbi:MAG: acylneuraminate cytidylyltransferase [Steroidobacteraceae bacterium]
MYGKPLQLLDVERGVSVLEHMIALARTEPAIEAVVLGIAEGPGNDAFVDIAQRFRTLHIRGSERDVLQRLIQCGEAAQATDVFRCTTESPFFYFEMIEPVWKRHIEAGNDVTVVDGLPEGSHFEIYTLEALRKSHRQGDDRHRSELCSLYVREHRDQFRVEVLPVPESVRRLDLRLTIDYPEDLVLCRAIYMALHEQAPRIPLPRIIEFIDANPDLQALVVAYVNPVPLF